ncbi:DeoR family transcriptional regulator [Virgibacillus dakarensis]|uniref:DeoR family transcriptional regulator n=1 Tax=Lentibacillus populi TaxID=1827502 RepID=A0A9W5TYS3_9BACI|nr:MULTISPECIES: DeoR/GlpR family DNA-binding transcription regulator [Bacillaceae]MBT2214821.1 DeoR/GlpR family DNA-binding transcription regulator [Virgibacillus dakarensis]MTW84579.1 DeoR family transcriptional regulator [Virgibacillus dakarensis]GGB47459.1 DeoR family transcriptional regulator [Lentibacillus populi]
MLTTERHDIILQLLREKQTITLQDIISATSASESTIRRDLTELEKRHELERIHGGATLTERKLQEFSISEKSAKNLQEKIAIAKYAASLVQEGDCIFLDAGTTTLQVIPFLQNKDAVIVTNGLTHLDSLVEHGITTYLTGGLIKAKTSALIGQQAVQSLQNYRFDKCFLGVNGFHSTYGYTTPDPEEAHIKQSAGSLAKEIYVLADYTKLNKVSFAKIFDLNVAQLITNKLDQQILAAISQETEVVTT